MTDQTVIPPARPQTGAGGMRIKNLVPRLPERGKIKIGVKGQMRKSSGGKDFQPPQKLDHFIVTTLDRGQDGNFVLDREFHRQHGDAPTEIPVRLLFDDPSLNFPTRYAAYVGRTLWCSGDGEAAWRISEDARKIDGGNPHQVQCPCHRQDPTYGGVDRCKMNGSLSVLIEGAGGLGGVWKWRTTSYNSILGVMSSMAFIRSLTGGPLAGIPFRLVLQKKKAMKPGTQDSVDIFVVNLEYAGTASELMATGHEIALERARTHLSIAHIEEEARRLLALPAPQNAALPDDEVDDVIEEFYPEQITAHPAGEMAEPQTIDHAERPLRDPNEPWPFVRWNGEPSTMPTRQKAVEAVEKILQARARVGLEALDMAWTNNDVLIVELNDAGYGDEATGLEALYQELREPLAPPETTETTTSAGVGDPEPAHDESVADAEVDPVVASVPDHEEPSSTPIRSSDNSGTRQSRDHHDSFWDQRSLEIPPHPLGKGKGAPLDWRTWPVLVLQRIRQAWTKETLDTLYLHNEDKFALFAASRGERALAELKDEFTAARLGLPFAADI